MRYNNNTRIGYKADATNRKIMGTPYTPISDGDKHGVVYSFPCGDCEGIYIGQTGQKLKNRIKQHQTDQNTTRTQKNHTAAKQHSLDTGHKFKFDDTKIVTRERNWAKRLTKEKININLNRRKAINLKSDLEDFNPIFVHLLENNKNI